MAYARKYTMVQFDFKIMDCMVVDTWWFYFQYICLPTNILEFDTGKQFLSHYFHNRLWAPLSAATNRGAASNQVNTVHVHMYTVCMHVLQYNYKPKITI